MLARAARALPRRQLSTAVPSLATGDDMGKLKPNEIGVKMLAAPFVDSGKGASHTRTPLSAARAFVRDAHPAAAQGF